MANDFEDLYDLGNMSDDDLRDLVLEELSEYPELDVDLIEVSVRNGKVSLTGRVGTEQEIQQVEHVLTDVLGVEFVSNELMIDELTRGERSQEWDEAAVEERVGNPQQAEGTLRTSDEASHLTENLEAEQYGVDDPGEANKRGVTYEPPVRPVREGTESREQH
jgi:hypothetical protein